MTSKSKRLTQPFYEYVTRPFFFSLRVVQKNSVIYCLFVNIPLYLEKAHFCKFNSVIIIKRKKTEIEFFRLKFQVLMVEDI